MTVLEPLQYLLLRSNEIEMFLQPYHTQLNGIGSFYEATEFLFSRQADWRFELWPMCLCRNHCANIFLTLLLCCFFETFSSELSGNFQMPALSSQYFVA